jgi:hypothetical protein
MFRAVLEAEAIKQMENENKMASAHGEDMRLLSEKFAFFTYSELNLYIYSVQ